MRDIAADELWQTLDHRPVLPPQQIEESVGHFPLGPGEYPCGNPLFRRRWRIYAKIPTQPGENSCRLRDYVVKDYCMFFKFWNRGTSNKA
jgi:hypothetical protein